MVFAICAFWSCPLWAVTVSTEASFAPHRTFMREFSRAREAWKSLSKAFIRARHDWTFVTVAGLRATSGAELALSLCIHARGRESALHSATLFRQQRLFHWLTELRTSEPLGALFGYHIQRPC